MALKLYDIVYFRMIVLASISIIWNNRSAVSAYYCKTPCFQNKMLITEHLTLGQASCGFLYLQKTTQLFSEFPLPGDDYKKEYLSLIKLISFFPAPARFILSPHNTGPPESVFPPGQGTSIQTIKAGLSDSCLPTNSTSCLQTSNKYRNSPHTNGQEFSHVRQELLEFNTAGGSDRNYEFAEEPFLTDVDDKGSIPLYVGHAISALEWNERFKITNDAPQFSKDNGDEMLKQIFAGTTTAIANGAWNDPDTWDNGIPDGTADAVIPASCSVTMTRDEACSSITIESGGTLNTGSFALTVNKNLSNKGILSSINGRIIVFGDWNNTGIYTSGNNSIVEFTGTVNAIVSGTTSFQNLVVSKGSLNTTLTINGTAEVKSSTYASFTLNSGLIIISTGSQFSINRRKGFTIPAIGGIEVNGGILSTADLSINNYGLIHIVSGTANFGSGDGNSVRNSGNGSFIVENGLVNISGRLQCEAKGSLSPGYASGIQILGGTVTLNTVGQALSNVGSLNVTDEGTFNFTGGTIVFQNPSTAATELDLGLIDGSGNKYTEGGIFQFGNAYTESGSVFKLNSQIPLHSVNTTSGVDLELKSDLEITGQLTLDENSNLILYDHSLQIPVTETGIIIIPLSTGVESIPLKITFSSIASQGSIKISSFAWAGTIPANLSQTHYLNRHWNITSSGLGIFDASIAFSYLSGELTPETDAGNLTVYQTSTSTSYPSFNSSINSFTINNLSALGEFGAAECSFLTDLKCPDDIHVYVVSEDPLSEKVEVPEPTWNDICPGTVLSWILKPPAGYEDQYNENDLSGTGFYHGPDQFYLGKTEVTYTVSLSNNNSVSCLFTVTVSGEPEITCPPLYETITEKGASTALLNSGSSDDGYGLPTLDIGVHPLTWTWTITNPDYSVGATGTYDEEILSINGPPIIPDYRFKTDTSTITWLAENASGFDECVQKIVVTDKEAPTFTSAPYIHCVDMLTSVVYNASYPNPLINHDNPNLIKYPSPDYHTFKDGNSALDITALADNSCDPATLTIYWRIDFDKTPDPQVPGGELTHAPISNQKGQPSEYGRDILFPGNGVFFAESKHKITYWVVDCNGNTSDIQEQSITISPRPEIIKVNGQP